MLNCECSLSGSVCSEDKEALESKFKKPSLLPKLVLQSKQKMSVLQPFNFQKWLDENRDLLKPPVANKNLTPDSDEYIVMVVAGPNARKDYHYNETEEFFYQLEGNITVNVQVDGEVKSLDLGPGDMMTVQQKVPTALFVMKAALVW